MKHFKRFLLGGIGYYILESIFRILVDHGDTHWTMFILGGLSVVAIFAMDDYTKYSLLTKAILSGVIITTMEFMLGYLYTYILHSPIWTYGTADFMGIISFTWSLLWCGLSLLVLIGRRIITKQND